MTPRTAHTLRGTLCGLALLPLAACGGGDAGTTTTGTTVTGSESPAAVELTVLAAASLQETFTTIAEDFEAANPGVTVTLSFGPSSGLATQITNGAPADVFASASVKTMDTVVEAGKASDPATFARNQMEIATPADNPAGIDELTDLADPEVKVAICAAEVPCGVGAATVFENAALDVTPVSEETDVKAVLTKVRLGEVDAGIVYATDVNAAGADVVGVPIDADINAWTSYPIAALTDSASADAAADFVAYVVSAPAAEILTEAGFAPPEG